MKGSTSQRVERVRLDLLPPRLDQDDESPLAPPRRASR
jgi:hypothetical protein